MEQELQTDALSVIAVTITQIIKENLDKTPQEVIIKILEALPQLTVDQLTGYLTIMGDKIGIQHQDINDLISVLQQSAKDAFSDEHRASIWQDIAQFVLVAAHIVEGLVAPKWANIIRLVLSAYEGLAK